MGKLKFNIAMKKPSAFADSTKRYQVCHIVKFRIKRNVLNWIESVLGHLPTEIEDFTY
jgi:hypothetical protein